jgi:hypothetical protein
MREFDVMCLTLVEELSAREIPQIRKKAGVSQEMFSRYLNVPVTLVPRPSVGTRREEALRPVPQTPLIGQAQRVGNDRVTASTGGSSRHISCPSPAIPILIRSLGRHARATLAELSGRAPSRS